MKSKADLFQQTNLHSASTESLASLGAGQLAYIRSHKIKGQTVYVVYGADGQELAGFDNSAAANAACYENKLELVTLQ